MTEDIECSANTCCKIASGCNITLFGAAFLAMIIWAAVSLQNMQHYYCIMAQGSSSSLAAHLKC